MRNVFLALVLANLGLAAWHAWFRGTPAPRAPRVDVPSITLVSELDESASRASRERDSSRAASSAGALDSRSAAGDGAPLAPLRERLTPEVAAEEDAAVESAVATVGCVSVGPFGELAQAAAAAANLRAGGYAPTQRVDEDEISVGFWVYVENIPTPAEANEVVADLRVSGISDAYVIPDTGNWVSLGVFSEMSRAETRGAQARELGYVPTIAHRTRRATVYWVDIALQPGQTFELETLTVPGRILRLEERDCESTPQ